MKEEPNISVIIPAHNRATLISETLRSLLIQTVPAKEIIVVDDGSQDGTAQTVLEMLKLGETEKLKISEGKPWPEFKVIIQENAGPGAARNRGFFESTGEFIHFFDSDDIAAPNKHEVQWKALLDSGADIAYGPWVKGRFLPVEKLKYGKAETLKAELTTEDTESTEDQFVQKQGGTWAGQVCATESDSLTSKPADSPVSESPIRSADGPASSALDAGRSTLDATSLADAVHSRSECSGVFEEPSSSLLGSGPAKAPPARAPGVAASASPSVLISDISGSNFSRPWSFTPEGPVLQARGLPAGSLIKALLTNWSVVPHACLFRRSIVEKIGGFAEESFGYEDQFMFLRCLLAGALVVHTPGTLELYRTNNPGKLTESGESQKKFAFECCRFVLQAKVEVEKREWFSYHPPNKVQLVPIDTRLKLESPVSWFGFRLRAYDAWRDLEKFFPGEKLDCESELRQIWETAWFSGFIFGMAGFFLRKIGGLKCRIFGHRWTIAYRVGRRGAPEVAKFFPT